MHTELTLAITPHYGTRVSTAGIRIQPVDLDDPLDVNVWLQLLDGYASSREGGGARLAADVRASLPSRLAVWPGFYSWIAWQEGRASGVINCFTGFSTFAGRGLMNVHDVYVEPHFRRRGIAAALLGRAEEEAVRLGYCKLTLEVLEHNPARALYLSVGFESYQLDPSNGKALFLEKKLPAAPPQT